MPIYTVDELKGMSLAQLKKIGKALRVPRYTTWKKQDRERAIQTLLDTQECDSKKSTVTLEELENATLTRLKHIAKNSKLGIKNLRGYKKDDKDSLVQEIATLFGLPRVDETTFPVLSYYDLKSVLETVQAVPVGSEEYKKITLQDMEENIKLLVENSSGEQ